MTTTEERRGTGKRRGLSTPDRHLRREDRAARGRATRAVVPLEAHADPGPDAFRDPVGLLLGQAQTRVPELVPLRHGRMLVSPFTYYRGAALPMAADLASVPSSGLIVQLCGDAHLSNFGGFASPERRMLFDVNDFDETLPGPFEWDVKRLAASFAVAGRENGNSRKERHRILHAVAGGYRRAVRSFAQMSNLDLWYTQMEIDTVIDEYHADVPGKRLKEAKKQLLKARRHTSEQAFGKLTAMVDGRRQIVSMPPEVVPVEQLFADVQSDLLYHMIEEVLGRYRRTLQTDRRHLLDQFSLVQMARKVVGVGSVGTRAWITLMESKDGDEPLFLQAKEAQASVLSGYAPRSVYRNEGERVVAGQHLMQAQSDIFLGWTRVTGPDGQERDFYVRQLRDWKASVPIERLRFAGMMVYADLCARTLARAHARSGDRIQLAAYLGGSERFDHAIAEFAELYADRNERDYAEFKDAVKEGRAEAVKVS
jgi:uncharacterized protein (DUF2252 family)